MKLTLFYIPVRMLPVVLLCITYALLQAMAFRPVLSFPFGLLLLKSAADSLVFVGVGMLLVIAIRSSNYVKLDKYQRLVNYFTLGFLYVALWTGLSYLLSLLILGREHGEEIRTMIPLTALIGLLIYLIHLLIIHFHMLRKEGEAETDDNEVEDEQSDLLEVHGNENGNGEETLERVAVKTGQKIHVILVPDIVYIQSDGDYVQIVTGQARYLKEETMKYFEASLPRSKFVRVHRSYIVNVEKILRIELYEKQNQMLTLKNGDQIRASVSGYKELRTILNL